MSYVTGQKAVLLFQPGQYPRLSGAGWRAKGYTDVRGTAVCLGVLTADLWRLRPVILLPEDMERGNETTLTYILTHEYIHVRRFGQRGKAGIAAVLCVHWFNPLAWVMYVLANRDLELSCDEL